MQTNLQIIVRKLTTFSPKPKQKVGGAKRRNWSRNEKHEKRYTSPCRTLIAGIDY